jgi:hypothetical protein
MKNAALLPLAAVIYTAVLLLPSPARADVQLPRFLSSGAVFQRDTAWKLWGKASPGEKIEVRLDGKSIRKSAARAKDWSLSLAAQPAGGPHRLEVIAKNRSVLEDVYFGDLWTASCQSNLELPMASDGAEQDRHLGGRREPREQPRASINPPQRRATATNERARRAGTTCARLACSRAATPAPNEQHAALEQTDAERPVRSCEFCKELTGSSSSRPALASPVAARRLAVGSPAEERTRPAILRQWKNPPSKCT